MKRVINGILIDLPLHLLLYTYRHAESIYRLEVPIKSGFRKSGFRKSGLFGIKSNNQIFLNISGSE